MTFYVPSEEQSVVASVEPPLSGEPTSSSTEQQQQCRRRAKGAGGSRMSAFLLDRQVAARLAAAVYTWQDIHRSLVKISPSDQFDDDEIERNAYGRERCSTTDNGTSTPSLNKRRNSVSSCDSADHWLEVKDDRFARKKSLSEIDLTLRCLQDKYPDISLTARKALARSPMMKRAVAAETPNLGDPLSTAEQRGNSAFSMAVRHRTSKYWIDPRDAAEHIWQLSGTSPSSTHHDSECYVGEKECLKLGDKKRCVACHIATHTGCAELLYRMNIACKQTHRDTSQRRKQQYEEKQLRKQEEQNDEKEKTTGVAEQEQLALRQLSSDAAVSHHWVHRWKQDGRCRHCGKSFQQKLFRDKEIIALNCSWCKAAYHNKPGCFTSELVSEQCDRGVLVDMLVPPTWLLRVSSSENSKKLKNLTGVSSNHGGAKKKRRRARPFVVKPLGMLGETPPRYPLLVFVNPKSGGNKGAKMLNTLCWLLNPRQVFDIMALKGPKFGLEMYRKCVSQLRILICGGDGTVGWVLSTLDALRWPVYPPIAIVPLGTGNDLSRTMGWSGTFTDEPMNQILQAVVHDSVVVGMDRWIVTVIPNEEANSATAATAGCSSGGGGGTTTTTSFDETEQLVSDCLPLNVINNYFSIGADAHIALQFHHSRSNNPQLFNSRFKNRLAYGGIGTIDLFRRSWKDLSDYISVVCDGQDMTPKIRESRFHCLLFLNIPFYAGGTTPWGSAGGHCTSGDTDKAPNGSPTMTSPLTDDVTVTSLGDSTPTTFTKPSVSDGKIEVLGFTTATLAALQMSGRAGERLAQCSQITISTTKPIPMQVDGEPCLLAPSHIAIDFHCKASLLKRQTGRSSRLPYGKRRSGSTVVDIPTAVPVTTTSEPHVTAIYDETNVATSNGDASSGVNDFTASTDPGTASPILASTSNGVNSHQPAIMLELPVWLVSKRDYVAFRDDLEKLKETAYETGTISVEAETELSRLRLSVQRILDDHDCLPYKATSQWRFLDCVSNAEEGAFRMPQEQEPFQTVADAVNFEFGVLIMDDHFPSVKKRSIVYPPVGIEPILVPVEPSSFKGTTIVLREVQRRHRRKQIIETLTIVLKTESEEAHL